MFNTLKVLRLPAGVQYDEDCDYPIVNFLMPAFFLPAGVQYDEDCDVRAIVLLTLFLFFQPVSSMMRIATNTDAHFTSSIYRSSSRCPV